MKVAFAVWDNRIAPVFDVAQQIRIIEAEAGQIVREAEERLNGEVPTQKALQLVEHGIGTLVCGAISRPLQIMLTGYGIEVIPFMAGDLQEIIKAWLSGRLNQNHFAMPGCCRRGRNRNINHEEYFMNGRRGGGRGQGQGGGGGRGQGGQGRGRMGGPFAGGPSGSCICPKCGYKETHQMGVPCTQKKCPTCGIALSRE